MPERPCIKGIAIRALIDDANALIARGGVDHEALARRLTPGDMDVLGDQVLDSLWYDIGTYRRLSELLRDHVGGGDAEYIRKRGAAVAERLIGLGVYQQVDFLRRMGRAENVELAVSNLRLTATLWNSFFNFGKWEVFRGQTLDGGYGMDVTESSAMPEVGWLAVHGFMTRLAREAAGQEVPVLRERSRGGHVRFVFASEVRSG